MRPTPTATQICFPWPLAAFDGTWTRFPGHLRRGREGHWRHAGSLTTAVPAALVLPRSGSSVDVDILVRQDITNAHAKKLFLQKCPNLPLGYECIAGRAEHVEALSLRTHRPHRLVSGRLGSGLRWGTDSHVTTNPLVLKSEDSDPVDTRSRTCGVVPVFGRRPYRYIPVVGCVPLCHAAGRLCAARALSIVPSRGSRVFTHVTCV